MLRRLCVHTAPLTSVGTVSVRGYWRAPSPLPQTLPTSASWRNTHLSELNCGSGAGWHVVAGVRGAWRSGCGVPVAERLSAFCGRERGCRQGARRRRVSRARRRARQQCRQLLRRLLRDISPGLIWASLVTDPGTMIAASTGLAITTINLVWYLLRRLGLRAFLRRRTRPPLRSDQLRPTRPMPGPRPHLSCG